MTSRGSIHAGKTSYKELREKKELKTESQNNSDSDFSSEPEESNQLTPESTKYGRKNAFKTEYRQQSHLMNFVKSYFFIIAVLIIIVAVIVKYSFINLPKEHKPKNCSFEDLKKKYPQENKKIWSTLKVGIESLLNDKVKKPNVYLFAHHDATSVLPVIENIATHASRCFDNQSKALKMEKVDFSSASDIKAEDYGAVIEIYKRKIKNGNVILIANLNDIPPEAAKSLHAICDTHSPINKNVIIFLTLTVSPTKIEGNDNYKAENSLRELWSQKLPPNELDPLITRVTEQVLLLN